MYYADYKQFDMMNGWGIRNSLFVSGCTHECKGCFNEKAWNFQYGEQFDTAMLEKIIADLRHESVRGLSLLGGDPMQNRPVLSIVRAVKVFHPDKDIWCWTGYKFEELTGWQKDALQYIDVLVDGKFEENNKDLTLEFRGSSNQRVIDVRKSLEKGEIVLWEQQ